MKKVIIFANGPMKIPGPYTALVDEADLIICADGGARHCLTLGITPDLVVGDLDSLKPSEIEAVEAKGARIERHPRRKDSTDLELSIKAAISNGAEQITILGGLGGRLDMTFGNVLLLAEKSLEKIEISFVDGRETVFLIRGGKTRTVQGKKGDTLSLIPIESEAKGITLSGLEYPLNDETIGLGFARGISNVMMGNEAGITLRNGILLVVHTRQE